MTLVGRLGRAVGTHSDVGALEVTFNLPEDRHIILFHGYLTENECLRRFGLVAGKWEQLPNIPVQCGSAGCSDILAIGDNVCICNDPGVDFGDMCIASMQAAISGYQFNTCPLHGLMHWLWLIEASFTYVVGSSRIQMRPGPGRREMVAYLCACANRSGSVPFFSERCRAL